VLVVVTLLPGWLKAEAGVLGKLEQVTGDVRVTAADGTVRTIASEAAVHPGDTVRTFGTQNSTVMTYEDGTRLTLVGDTAVTFGSLPSKNLVVHQGTLGATVRPQPSGAPMRLATPSAEMQVLGTRFLVDAVANRTDVRVTEGRIRLVRSRDGRAVEITDGKRAVVSDQPPLVVEDTPPLSADWAADFEAGVAEGWNIGGFVTEGLPPGSRGGVKAVRIEDSEDGRQYAIMSPEEWVPGLFDPKERSHLHVTFRKAGPPAWLNVFLCCRTDDADDPRFAGNYLFNDFPRLVPGRWYTASIPLAKFVRQHRGLEPIDRLVPHRLIFVGGEPGLVIDRVWVTPEGTGEFELTYVE
jgi:hypothetical protein